MRTVARLGMFTIRFGIGATCSGIAALLILGAVVGGAVAAVESFHEEVL